MFPSLRRLIVGICIVAAVLSGAHASGSQAAPVNADRMTRIALGAGPQTPARRLLGQRLGAPQQSGMVSQVQLANGTFAILSAIARSASHARNAPPGTYYLLKLDVPSTGQFEIFGLHVPGPASSPAPLVVGFHSYDTSHLELMIGPGAPLLQEAVARDWFFLAPFQRSGLWGNEDINFGSVQSQVYVEAVVQWVMSSFPVDPDRLYGLGFSMGGGSAMSYAARHRDRRTGAFAAVANHTGTIALADVWENQPELHEHLFNLFGDTPSQAPFAYQRSSTIELDGAGQLLPGGRHMAVNLGAVDLGTYFHTGDVNGYMVDQSERLTDFVNQQAALGNRFATYTETRNQIPSPSACPKLHCWGTVDATQLFNWFDGKTLLELPPAGTLLADRSGRWHGFDLVQAATSAFSSFDFVVDPSSNLIELVDLENVESVDLDLVELGLDPAQRINVQLSSRDAQAHTVRIRGLAGPPTTVTRVGSGLTLGQACPNGVAPNWCFTGGVLELVEAPGTVTAGALGVWQIQP